MKTLIEMAKEAGIFATFKTLHPSIEIFAELVRADAIAIEREACAEVVENLHPGLSSPRIAEHIRARTSS